MVMQSFNTTESRGVGGVELHSTSVMGQSIGMGG
jgi:hypothetical protein